jgi:peptidyl-prolyl cis-trans isomerase A (cyclophilin A)
MRRAVLIFLMASIGLINGCGGGGGGDDAPSPSLPTPPTVTKTSAYIETTMGNILIELFEQEAPNTVANFIGLAEGTKPNRAKPAGTPFYDGLIFHRVIPGFMIQGGDPLGTGTGGPGYAFADEFSSGLKYDRAGRVGMANSGANTNGSQFFIVETNTPQTQLDNKHTIFGQVTSGQEVVTAIANVPRSNDRPNTPVTMTKVTILRP